MKRILFLLFGIYASFSAAASHAAQSVDHEWLEFVPLNRFSCLADLPPNTFEQYREKLIPYLNARGVNDDIDVENFVHKDIYHIAHALSILFEQESVNVLHQFLGSQYALVDGYSTHIDHVGRELYGPLSFYLPFLERIAEQVGLVCVRNIVFPSTQVVKVLQQHDPDLSGVTIGRIYFQDVLDGKVGCLELFQASSLDEKCPQKIEFSKERISLLTATYSSSSQNPIDHLALELGTKEDIQKIHDCIHHLASDILMPYQEKVSYNPGDGSTQTKVFLRDSNATVFNKIIEFVHYE